jgi:hypothetical protein
VPVETQLRAPRRVAANLEKQGAEILIVDVEIVVVDVDGLVPVELELPVHLLPVERLGLLLRDPDEDDLIPHWPLPSNLIGDVVLLLFVVELVNRNVVSLGLCFHRLTEAFRHLPENRRRRNRFPQLASHEPRQSPSCRQFADVAVQVESIQALHFQCDVPV